MSVAGCLGSSSDSGVVKVGVLSPLSGDWTVYGEAHLRGIELAAQEINNNGGINGENVEIVLRDTETQPSVVTERANELIRSENVDVIAGTFSSAERNAAAPVITENDIPLLYPTFYEGQSQEFFPGACNDLLFMFGPVPAQQSDPWMEYMTSEFGDRFYMIGSDYVWPRETNRRVRSTLEGIGGTVVGEEYIPLGTSDFSSPLNNIADANPDIVFGTLTGQDTINFGRQFYNQELQKEITYWTVDDEEFATEGKGPEASAGTYVSFDYFQVIDTPENTEFVDKVQNKYGSDAGMNTVGAAMYNAGHAFAQAANQVGSVETDDLINGLEGLTFQGPQGEITMREEDHQAVLPSYLARVNEGFTDYDDMFEIIDSVGPTDPGDTECRLPLTREE
jgi:urea transport system substrate-binding protein